MAEPDTAIPHPESEPRRRFTVTRAEAGRPLGDLLAAHCPEAPVGFLNRLIRKGLVLVDRSPATRRERPLPGREVALYLPKGAFLVAPNPEVPFDVVYEDDALAVLDKPAGVVSEPGIGHKLDTLLNGLVARYGEAIDRLGPARDFGLVHRLDRDTSGLIVATRTAKARETLAAAFRKHKVEKAYVALLCGTPPESEGRVDIPLGRTRKRGRAVPVIGGAGTRPALTRYRIVERFGDYALVEARPETGRWHQVRLHFAAIGRPVAGDAEHGDVRANDRLAQQAALERLFLHSAVLGFDHPETGRRMTFRSHLPPPLGAVLDVLRGR